MHLMVPSGKLRSKKVLPDFFGAVGVVLLDLPVLELEHLQSVLERSLRRLRLCEVVNYFLVRIGLLDVVVVEIYDRVAIGPALALHAVVEDDLLLATLKCALDFSIVTDDLLSNLLVG
jgi:hypothetical protein